jgi:aromatic-L-amino-acid/L-tryptophan decarboxylase
MTPEEFETWGGRVVEWIGSYFREMEAHPVLSRAEPGETRRRLPSEPPLRGQPLSDLLADFDDVILPGITHWNHPGFLAYFAISGSGPGLLAEMLAAALNVNAMVWRTSPAATELEEHVVGWMAGLLGLSSSTFGVIQDTASSSSLVALAAARHRAYPEVREEGLFGLPPGRIYTSQEAHSSIEKAGIALGLGRRGVQRIGTDSDFRMDTGELEAALDRDRRAGIRPVAIVATLGTTSTTSCDPVAELVGLARRYDTWLHVDAAYAGAAALLPECAGHFQGWEDADSVVVNPHKWLFTQVDCSLLFTRHREFLRSTFSLTPEYLQTPEGEEVTQLMDYGLALGRRFRSLKLWFVIRYFGVEGIQARVRRHIELARDFGGWVDEDARWLRVAPVPFSTVVFRFAPPDVMGKDADELNRSIMDDVNDRGDVFLSHTRVGERFCLRVSVGHLRTERVHMERCWAQLQEAADAGLRAL